MKTKKAINILIIVFTILVLFLASYFLFFSVKFDESYLQAVKSKRHKLEKIEYSKIVVTGDINVTTSIDSKIIENELGLPVVNMAINSSIGYKKILSYVKRDLNENDIFIFSPGYDIVLDERWNGLETSEIVKANNIFTADIFDKDNLKEDFFLNKAKINVQPLKILDVTFSKDKIEFMRKYNEFLKKRGVHFYISPTLFVEGVYKKQDAINFWNTLSKKTDIPLLNKSSVNFLNKTFFDNASNIPNLKGRVVRTKQFIEDIKNKQFLKTKTTHLVPKEPLKNNIGLSSFNDFSSVKIIEKTANHLMVLPDKEANYIRIKHKGKDYTNYTFSIKLECKKENIKNIKFMGTVIQDFDYIKEKGNNVFELFKNKMDGVYYKNNKSSYIGITTLNINEGDKIKIINVNLNKMDSRFISSENVANDLEIGEQQKLSFRVFSPHKKFKVSEIFKMNVKKDLLLNTNNLFRLETTKNNIYIRNFYTGENIYKEELDKGFKLKSFENTMIEVFQQR